MKRLFISLIIGLVLYAASMPAQIRILTIGDSTMADYDEVKNSEQKEKRGWAQMLPYFLTDDVKLDNAAKNGRSSKSFYFEFWHNLRETLKPNDFVIIQFGHNDEKNDGKDTPEIDPKERGTAPWSQYVKYLTKYVEETREKGAIPILATPVVRRMFNTDGKTLTERGKHNLVEYSEVKNDSILNYVLAMKHVAQSLSVPLVDMTMLTGQLLEGLGPDKSKELIYCVEDNTHLSAMGGLLFSKLFAEDLTRQNILTKFIRFPKEVALDSENIEFPSQLVSTPLIKAFSICGMDLSAKDTNIEIYVNSPFEVSFLPDRDFTQKLSIKETGDFYKPVFVRFIPKKEVAYSEQLIVSINGKEHQINLKGTGILANKNKITEVKISANNLNHPLIKGNISTEFDLKELKVIKSEDHNQELISIEDNNWPTGEIDVNSSRYIELTVIPSEDTYLNHISFELKSIGGNAMQFTALGSTNNNFAKTDSYVVMETMKDKEIRVYSFDTMIKVAKGEIYKLRIYPWYKGGGTEKYILLNTLSVKGLAIK